MKKLGDDEPMELKLVQERTLHAEVKTELETKIGMLQEEITQLMQKWHKTKMSEESPYFKQLIDFQKTLNKDFSKNQQNKKTYEKIQACLNQLIDPQGEIQERIA